LIPLIACYSLFKVFCYLSYYFINIIEYLFVSEPHHMIPHSLQIVLPDSIVFLLLRFGMIPAVHFYDKAAMSGNEIYDVISYYMLSEEVNTYSIVS